jgi:hypothetical protein
MKAKQLYFVLIGLLVLALGSFAAVAYGANKLMGNQANKLSTLRAKTIALNAQEVTLTKNKRDIVKYGDLNTVAQTIVPQDKDQAQAVREIVNIATQSGIAKLSSITFPTSTLGALAGPGAHTNPGLTQLVAVKGMAGVYSLQITITQTSDDEVTYDRFIAFLSKLEQNRRTAQVGSITIQPDTQDPNQVAFNLVINEFIKP